MEWGYTEDTTGLVTDLDGGSIPQTCTNTSLRRAHTKVSSTGIDGLVRICGICRILINRIDRISAQNLMNDIITIIGYPRWDI